MHNSGILERQYWANQKIEELCKHEKNIIKRGKSNQMQLKTPRMQRRRRGKIKTIKRKKTRENAALKVSAQN